MSNLVEDKSYLIYEGMFKNNNTTADFKCMKTTTFIISL